MYIYIYLLTYVFFHVFGNMGIFFHVFGYLGITSQILFKAQGSIVRTH